MARQQLAFTLAWGVAAGGCSLLSLDVLQTGREGEGGATASSSAGATSGEAPSAGPVTGSGGGATSSGETISASSTGGGGAGPASSSTSTGSGCPDFCAGLDATFCDAFDGPDGLSRWDTAQGFENGSTFTLVADPHVSCPNAARIDFSGVTGGKPGGWAELEQILDGSPMQITLSAWVRRTPTNPAMEGVMELYWASGDKQCQVQVQMGADPSAIQFFAGEFSQDGSGTPMGGEYLALGDTPTVDTWLDLELQLELGSVASAKLTVGGGLSRSFTLDEDGAAECDQNPPTAGEFSVLIGAPFNSAATTLYYDDVVIRAE